MSAEDDKQDEPTLPQLGVTFVGGNADEPLFQLNGTSRIIFQGITREGGPLLGVRGGAEHVYALDVGVADADTGFAVADSQVGFDRVALQRVLRGYLIEGNADVTVDNVSHTPPTPPQAAKRRKRDRKR